MNENYRNIKVKFDNRNSKTFDILFKVFSLLLDFVLPGILLSFIGEENMGLIVILFFALIGLEVIVHHFVMEKITKKENAERTSYLNSVGIKAINIRKINYLTVILTLEYTDGSKEMKAFYKTDKNPEFDIYLSYLDTKEQDRVRKEMTTSYIISIKYVDCCPVIEGDSFSYRTSMFYVFEVKYSDGKVKFEKAESGSWKLRNILEIKEDLEKGNTN